MRIPAPKEPLARKFDPELPTSLSVPPDLPYVYPSSTSRTQTRQTRNRPRLLDVLVYVLFNQDPRG